MPASPDRPTLLSPWRRRCQWFTTLLLLLPPWIQLNGKSLLRIDIPKRSLYCFGQILRIEELYLLLILSLIVTLGFLLVTLVLGRVWCGWFCPQTTMSDLVEWFAHKLKIRGKKRLLPTSMSHRLALHSFYAALSLLVASNLLWYFIEPQRFFVELFTGQLHYAAVITFAVVAATVYLNLALVRRLMCSDFCPYGRLQAALADDATLSLSLPETEQDKCIECGACVRICPMEIDIRQGEQIECINCGRCLDACRRTMARRQNPGLIRYRFGAKNASTTTKGGWRALLNSRTIALSAAVIALTTLLLLALWQRPEASLKIALSHTAHSRVLKDGTQASFFNAWINNRSDAAKSYRVEAIQRSNGKRLSLKGQTDAIALEAGGNLRVDFVLVSVVPEQALAVEFILYDQTDIERARAEARVRSVSTDTAETR
ncbi:MAG: 4Fe-4S binding protein [Desulfuromonadales bacterium]|nr:4Fe-4S binding protein [Desulfuromonadales bacterium]